LSRELSRSKLVLNKTLVRPVKEQAVLGCDQQSQDLGAGTAAVMPIPLVNGMGVSAQAHRREQAIESEGIAEESSQG
jgi:hypothetical protein